MYANEDIYSGSVDPNNKINPKIVGAFYINTKTAKLFVCTDNTINNNTWKMCNPDIKIPEIPPPAPLYFTTCEFYYMSNGPYKNGVIYTNTENVPICIIFAAPFEGGTNNDIWLDVGNKRLLSGNEWGNNITAIIVPGTTFKLETFSSDPKIHYIIIK